jgi:hypothetical protein
MSIFQLGGEGQVLSIALCAGAHEWPIRAAGAHEWPVRTLLWHPKEKMQGSNVSK